MDNMISTLIGVVVGAFATGLVSHFNQQRQFKHDKEMLSLQHKSEEKVKSILNEMLNHRENTDRSFAALKNNIGGYSEDQIRQFLHEIGAKKTSTNNGQIEWWYLDSREKERSAKAKKTPN